MRLSHRVRSVIAGLVPLCLALALPAPARAQTIIGNLPPQGSEQVSNELESSRGAVSFRMNAGAYNLDGVKLRLSLFNGIGGAEINNNPAPLVELRDDGGTVPGSNVLTTFQNPTFSGGNAATDYTFLPGSAVTLEANTKYWVYVYGAAGGGEYFWYRSTTGVTPTSPSGAATFGEFRRSQSSGATWFDDGRLNSFEVLGTPRQEVTVVGDVVPEPTSILLFLPGLAAVSLRRRRKPAP